MMLKSSPMYRVLGRVVFWDSGYGYVYLRPFQERLLADHHKASGI